VLLTREGCANTETLRANLDRALKARSTPIAYTVVDLASLPDTDGRTGYPTPTLLYNGRDVFGLAEPRRPFGSPT